MADLLHVKQSENTSELITFYHSNNPLNKIR